jgi:hypothetical protein
MKSQAETIADLSARCAGSNEFENFDRAFRNSRCRRKRHSGKMRGGSGLAQRSGPRGKPADCARPRPVTPYSRYPGAYA